MTVYLKYIFILTIITITLPLYSQKKINPQKASSKGIELGQQKKYDEALIEFEKSLKSYNTNSAKVYHNKGWVLELKGDEQGAISAYEEAVKRNPVQIHSLERVGFLYFQTGRYEEAVQTGERVINLDPKNQEVIKWLSEAYRLKIQKHQEKLLAQKDEEKKKKEDKSPEEEEEEKKPSRIVYATLDFMIRTAYYFREGEEDKGYMYKTTPGLYANVPEMLHVNVTPTKMFEFDLEMGNPYLGALSPNLVIHTEKLEAIAHLGKYSLGLGVLGNHYRSSFAFSDGKNRTLHDFKTGFIFGYKQDNASLLFKLYPRALPHDGESSSGKTFDTDYAEFDYKYSFDKLLTFYSWISARDYYFFDHEIKISNYWGVYELGIGIQLGKYKNIMKWLDYLSISVDFTERFYMLDLNNDKPYHFANGQGWFGANADKWFEGDPFSGYRAPGHVFTVRVEEGIIKNLFVYQAIIVEMVDRREDHNEFNLLFGVGGEY